MCKNFTCSFVKQCAYVITSGKCKKSRCSYHNCSMCAGRKSCRKTNEIIKDNNVDKKMAG